MRPDTYSRLKSTPYWWEGAPLSRPVVETPLEPVDVAIVGGGLSGLFTALHLARGGLKVAVLEAEIFGLHASTRNFGAIGRTIRLSFSELAKRDGIEKAIRVFEEAKTWVEFTAGFIEREGIDCRFYRNGRVVAAHSRKAYDASARELEFTARHIELDTALLEPHAMQEELGSKVYHGGVVLSDVGHLDPGRYFSGLFEKVVESGASLYEQCRVSFIEKVPHGHRLLTPNGYISAREVVLTTNAETGADCGLFRYFRRRMVPIPVYSAVSEPLDPELLNSVVPKHRTVLETRRLYTAMRPIDPENRLIVVSRHFCRYRNIHKAAYELKEDILVRYPQLAGLSFSHLWEGRFGVTFDWLPHFGTHEGIHYLLGLNGAGVPATGYLANKLTQRILGQPNQESVFADTPFPSHIGYSGNPWFLPTLGHYYRWLDRRESGLVR